MPVDLIVLAAIAVFVLLRLYGVLGQKIGHDEPPSARDATFDTSSKVIELTPKELEKVQEVKAEEENPDMSDALKEGIAAIRKHDAAFRLSEFSEGAKMAFEMVLESFAKADYDTLKQLLSKDLYLEFSAELKKRKNAEQYTETTLVSILEATVNDVKVKDRHATVVVNFLSEQIQTERDKSGEAVKESTSAIEQVEDTWTFTRDLRSPNPNWTIIDT